MQALSVKYNLDLDEARAEVIGEIKFNKKRGPIPKFHIETDVVKKKTKSSGYIEFSHAMRESLRVELSARLKPNEKLNPQTLIKEMGVRWNLLTDSGKAEWNAYAKSDAGEGLHPPPLTRQPAKDFAQDNVPKSAFASGIVGKFTMEELEQMRNDASAEDVPIDFETMTYWELDQVVDYFESGGELVPDLENISKLPLLKAKRQAHTETAEMELMPEDDESAQEEEADPEDDESVQEEEAETEVVQFEVDGVMYLKDGENTLYDAETHEEIGEWNSATGKIVLN